MDQVGQIAVHRDGPVAILRMARAPTNAMSAAFCNDIRAVMDQCLADVSVLGVVLASDLSVFSAGSDVGDIVDPRRCNRADLQSLCQFVAKAHKPVVAALGGACLSTGLDLALACTARVASARASFGYPDVRLGLLPAGGGAYRLTRLIGAGAALEMILAATAKPAEEALELGLIDRLCAQGREIEQAALLAQTLAQGAVHSLDRRDFLAHLPEDMAAVATARAGLPAQKGHWAAHHRAVDTVEGALLLPETMALAQEAAAFDDVQRGPIARALCYAFVARQRAQPIQAKAGNPQTAPEAVLRRVMGDIVALFQDQGLARADILGAFASFGIGVGAGSALPDCPPSAGDVVPALLLAWANAGAGLLHSGQIARAEQVDAAALVAGMCPNWRGGPMFWAGEFGTKAVLADLQRRASAGGPLAQRLFTPSPLWADLVAQGLSLREIEVMIEPD